MKTTNICINSIIIILLFLITNKTIASPQSPDLLIYNGDTTRVYTLLLEKYFNQIKKNNDVDGQLFGFNFRDGATLNCWRGYQAIYKIENDSLFLEQITFCNEFYYSDSIDIKESKRRIKDIFGEKVKDGKVLIDWYSGNLSFSKPGSVILRWDGVFYTSYEEEILIEISKGNILNITEIKNYADEISRINRRYKDTVSNVIFEQIQKIKWKDTDKFDCSEKYLIKIGKEGRVIDVKMIKYQTKVEIKKKLERERI